MTNGITRRRDKKSVSVISWTALSTAKVRRHVFLACWTRGSKAAEKATSWTNALPWSTSVPSLSVQLKWWVKTPLGKRKNIHHPTGYSPATQKNSSYQSKRNQRAFVVLWFWFFRAGCEEVSNSNSSDRRAEQWWRLPAGYLFMFPGLARSLATGSSELQGCTPVDSSQARRVASWRSIAMWESFLYLAWWQPTQTPCHWGCQNSVLPEGWASAPPLLCSSHLLPVFQGPHLSQGWLQDSLGNDSAVRAGCFGW